MNGVEAVQTNTLETMVSARKERLVLNAEPDLLTAIEEHKRRIESSTGLRVTMSQAATSLMRRGLETVNAI
ncbi:hypothetical protein [Caballeronia sp. M23-90]